MSILLQQVSINSSALYGCIGGKKDAEKLTWNEEDQSPKNRSNDKGFRFNRNNPEMDSLDPGKKQRQELKRFIQYLVSLSMLDMNEF